MFSEAFIETLGKIGVPSTYFDKKSYEYMYWFRSLLQKIDSAIVFKNLPDGWPQDFFLLCLWYFGFVAVFKPDKKILDSFGAEFVVDNKAVFQPCTFSGYDFYYQPTKVLVANPLWNNSKELVIHKDCELLKLCPDFNGCWDILDFYASQLAEVSKGIKMGLINAKFPLILTANNQAQSDTLKKVYDKVQAGESLVVWKDLTKQVEDEIIPSKDPFTAWNNDFKSTYLVTNLLEDMQTILNSFYMEIGLPTILNDKKAHTLDAEADFQSAQAQARLSCWITTLKESLALINEKFGLNIEVEKYEEVNDDARENDTERNRDNA